MSEFRERKEEACKDCIYFEELISEFLHDLEVLYEINSAKKFVEKIKKWEKRKNDLP